MFLRIFFLFLILLLPQIAFADRLRDVRGPVALKFDLAWFWIFLLFVFIAVVVWVVFKYFLKPPETPALPPRRVWEIALEALGQLEQSPLVAQGKYSEYYFLLSAIVRQYIEARFEIRAAEMTTEEFMEHSKKSARLLLAHKKFLEDFLSASDMVKFAKFVPSINEAKDALRLAWRFVEETKITSVDTPIIGQKTV